MPQDPDELIPKPLVPIDPDDGVGGPPAGAIRGAGCAHTRTVCMKHNIPIGPQCRCMGPKHTEFAPCQRSCRMWGDPAVNGNEEDDVPNGRPRNHGRPLYVDAHAQIREWRVDFAQPDLDTRFCETLDEVIEAIIEHGLNGITVTTIFDLYDNETLLESVEHRVPPASLRRLFVDHHLIT